MSKDTSLFTYTTVNGKDYTFPTKYKSLPTVSSIIRSMIKDGYTKYQISKISGVRYQMVRNILLNSNQK